MVGQGLAIKPANETVCAPVSGKITVLMDDLKNAVGMTLSNGVEILIHVGINTVSMGDEGFSYLVKGGDVVKVELLFSSSVVRQSKKLVTPTR